MDILQQLGELVLGSLPTVAFFLLTVVLYTYLVHHPLRDVLAERHRRTVGAVDNAKAAIAAAEAKTAEYESRLRLARNEISLARDHRMQQWSAERDQVLAAARDRAQLKVKTAKLELEQSAHEARQQIEKSANELGDQVLAAVLPGRAA
jgi:F-type H+-transporting ATPase subunit b